MATTMNALHAPRDLQPYVRVAATGRPDDVVAAHRRLAAAGVLATLVLAVLLLITIEVRPGGTPASAAGSGPASASQPAVLPAGVADRFYIVEQGDSLWSIARALAPFRDVRTYVDELEALNGGTSIQPGQRLVLPGG